LPSTWTTRVSSCPWSATLTTSGWPRWPSGSATAATRARARQLGPDDLIGGTFTITNPGAAGTWLSFPILNAPQVGILATDGVTKRVVVDDRGGLRVQPMGNLCLTFDHRAIDGAYAGSFLERVRELVEERDWASEL
jgi:2-oxoglutarate dehydrogenase E2 component (dihydrolipoamide succinyltransferase)